MRERCGAICLIALFVDSSDQGTGSSKQLAPGIPHTDLLTDLIIDRLPLTALGLVYVEAKCIRSSHSLSQLEALVFNIPALSPKSE